MGILGAYVVVVDAVKRGEQVIVIEESPLPGLRFIGLDNDNPGTPTHPVGAFDHGEFHAFDVDLQEVDRFSGRYVSPTDVREGQNIDALRADVLRTGLEIARQQRPVGRPVAPGAV